MKKLISLLLALVMVFSLATVAFASEEEEEEGQQSAPSITIGEGDDAKTYTDVTSVSIRKSYKLANSGTISPEETFTLVQVGDGVVTDGDATSAPALPTITGAYFSKNAATVDGASGNIIVTLPTYTTVGIYEYTLKEEVGSTAGVTYRNESDTIKLVVTVMEGEGGKVRVAGVHYDAGENGKNGTIENTYSAGSLSVSKTVTGNLGDHEKYFEFKVTLTGEAGKNYAESYAVSGGSNTTDNPSSVQVVAGQSNEYTFYLKDSDTITIENLPYGVTYSVSETSYEDYETTKAGDSGTISMATQTASFTNNKEGTVDTGITLDTLPFVLILAVCAGAVVLFVVKRRRSTEF